MKKIFTILGIVASFANVATAQSVAFKGADFENWNEFTSGLNNHGLKPYATQNTTMGHNSSNSLNIKTTQTPPTTNGNDYVFTALPTINFSSINSISFYVNGTSNKALSINLFMSNGTNYNVFNIKDLNETDVTITPTPIQTNGNGKNDYKGAINTGGKWVKVTLNLANLQGGINSTDATKNFISFKIGKTAEYDLNIDNIMVDGVLATADFKYVKPTLVKNTVVSDNLLIFNQNTEVQILNSNGQVVKMASVKEGKTMDLSGLNTGVYFVTGTVNHEKVTQKIIKK